MALEVHISGPALSVATCARRLAPLGWAAHDGPDPDSLPPGRWLGGLTLVASPSDGLLGTLHCRISWQAPDRPDLERPASEATVQAELGLMHLHGLARGAPRRLGIEVASVAAGMLAAQGVLAALIGWARGLPVSRVGTSVMGAGALLISQTIARAGAGPDDGTPAVRTPATWSGPPFPTAEGGLVEIETLTPQPWAAFWSALGAPWSDVVAAWPPFSSRYAHAICSLPPSLHAATRRQTLRDLARLASTEGMSLCPVRGVDEVLDGDARTVPRHPLLTPSPRSAVSVSPRTASASAGAPLDGITAVEASSRLQGPLAGQLLRMLGARVIRVEPPGGDAARLIPPLAGETGAYFLAVNRGKETLELDLRSGDGVGGLREVIGGADAFLHNWRPGRAESIGMGPTELTALSGGLVHCHAGGWGAAAAGCPPLALEYLVQARTAMGALLSPEGEPPFPSPLLLADVMGALLACEGVLSGLWLRERTGAGCRVETSLLSGAMALEGHILDAIASGRERGRRRGRPLWGPGDRPARTASEWTIREEGLPPAAVRTDLRTLPDDPGTAALLEPVEGVAMVRAPWSFSPA